MDSRQKGAWVVHNANKLAKFSTQDAFEATYESGRAGVLLSVLSRDEDVVLSHEKVSALSSLNGIGHLETKALLSRLQEKNLVKLTVAGVIVEGVSPASTLEHTNDLFVSGNPKPLETAAIGLSQRLLAKPAKIEDFRDEISDSFQLTKSDFSSFVDKIESYGIVDYEDFKGEKIYFNGHLFNSDINTHL